MLLVNLIPSSIRLSDPVEIRRARDRARDTGRRRLQVLAAGRRYRLRGYGISVETYDRLVEVQGSRCACCGATEPGGRRKFWCIDHDHVTGVIRGLLCATCNAAIGFLGDGIEGARRALAYLERHYEKGTQ